MSEQQKFTPEKKDWNDPVKELTVSNGVIQEGGLARHGDQLVHVQRIIGDTVSVYVPGESPDVLSVVSGDQLEVIEQNPE